MKNPQIDIRKEIEEIRIVNNEFLTVYLQDGDSNIQVELRVTPEGKAEIYCNRLSCVKTFKKWYDIED